MHIFVDESGTFTKGTAEHSISLVGALIIPDGRLAALEKKYRALRPNLPKDKDKVKGRLLSERQVNSIVSMLAKHEVLLEISAIDMGIHEDADIAEHKELQAQRLTRRLTSDHHPNVRAGIFALRDRLERMTHQLYVQSTVTIELIATVIQHATFYYCQRNPKELGAFHWMIDAKERGRITNWEDWWSFIVMSFLQSKSLRKPMIMLREGDYSYFERFRTTIGEHLKPYIEDPGSGEATDVGKLMSESFRFSSDPEPGLELVDILANATRRALMGKLGLQGWRDIRRLMISRPRHYIQIVALLKRHPPIGRWPYMSVLRHFSAGGKTMFAPRFLRS